TYLSRTISYGPSREPDGSVAPNSAVEYEPLLHRLSEAERRQYDSIADLWSEILFAFEGAEGNANEKRNGHRYSQFYSAQQRFFLQLMMAYTLTDLIPAIENDLASGRSIVLSLFNTGESQTERKVQQARASGIDLSELDATPREMIVQLVQNHFPIHQFIEKTDPVTGNVVRVRVEDEDGNPEINRENQRQQEALLDKIADLDFPQNPLDAIISHFGVENVAEISGRSHRFEHGKYVRRKLRGVSRRELNAHETKLFQNGEKRIAIISGAGSTGISTHADRHAKNQDRRVFYAFQLSWSADQQMQAFGRVHRSNQSSAPIVRLVLVDLAGQKRLVNSVSKRLAALGALTKGERHSLSSDLFRPEDVTDHFGKSALSKLYREVQLNEHLEAGLSLSTLDRMGVLNSERSAVRDSYASNVEQFLHRIMVLHVVDQNRIFDLFYERYQRSVEAAKRQGSFDFGVEEVRATKLRQVGEPEVLFTDPASGAETKLHELEGQVKVLRNSFTVAVSDAKLGFFQNLKSGRLYAVAPHWSDERNDLSLTSVRGQARSIERSELVAKYREVEKFDAKQWWDAEFERTPSTESRKFYVLSGAIFPIYDKVMGRTGIQTAKIARARLADGSSLVGLRLNSQDVPQVKERLGIGTPLAAASIEELTELVAGGSTLELDNGWRLRRAMISGDRVIELVLSGVPANRDELRGYGLIEESIHFKRRW
ncbi:MAG: strawberry notch C-terminal domain-containing protein, partial [Lacipirellulaceae bacterium]